VVGTAADRRTGLLASAGLRGTVPDHSVITEPFRDHRLSAITERSSRRANIDVRGVC